MATYEWMKKWIAKNPEKWKDISRRSNKKRNDAARERLNLIKNKPCMDCGGSFPPECMHFDHVRGEKLFNIGAKPTSTKLMDEIAKCDLVCANCHAIRTSSRGWRRWATGT